MWFRKEKLDSKEYIKLLHKFEELSTEVAILMANINLLKNRKWGKDRKKPDEEQTENLKSSDGLDTLRGL